jgi:hypothetical protein
MHHRTTNTRVSNAAYIHQQERKHHQWAREIDLVVLRVTGMSHDIGDAKYQTSEE